MKHFTAVYKHNNQYFTCNCLLVKSFAGRTYMPQSLYNARTYVVLSCCCLQESCSETFTSVTDSHTLGTAQQTSGANCTRKKLSFTALNVICTMCNANTEVYTHNINVNLKSY